jgi:hypothetical protein
MRDDFDVVLLHRMHGEDVLERTVHTLTTHVDDLEPVAMQRHAQPEYRGLTESQSETREAPPGSALELLGVATRLAVTSFGGPVAHLGCFRERVRATPTVG